MRHPALSARQHSMAAGVAQSGADRQGARMSDEPHRTAEHRLAELRAALGDEHPDTLAAMIDLAEALWPLGRLSRARQLEEEVVTARRRLLGPEHPDTLKALGKLATTIGALGDLAEAR